MRLRMSKTVRLPSASDSAMTPLRAWAIYWYRPCWPDTDRILERSVFILTSLLLDCKYTNFSRALSVRERKTSRVESLTMTASASPGSRCWARIRISTDSRGAPSRLHALSSRMSSGASTRMTWSNTPLNRGRSAAMADSMTTAAASWASRQRRKSARTSGWTTASRRRRASRSENIAAARALRSSRPPASSMPPPSAASTRAAMPWTSS